MQRGASAVVASELHYPMIEGIGEHADIREVCGHRQHVIAHPPHL